MNEYAMASDAAPVIDLATGLEPMRVVRIPRFLPQDERDALYDAVCANQAAFQPPGNPQPTVVGSLYLPLNTTWNTDTRPGAGSLPKACEFLTERILGLLPTLFTALGITPFPVSALTLTLINGLDGHCGSPHADDSGDRFQISLLYYFHSAPKAFRGGNLEFYDADPASPYGFNSEAKASIDHQDNLLLAFPSKTFHGITEVHCDTNRFEDGRFVAVGFLGAK